MNALDLQKLGLTEKESKAYLALLNLEETLVSEVSKRTQINRSLVYSVLESLSSKGLASYIVKNNLRYYRAAPPEKIVSMIREKEALARILLPALNNLYKPRTKKPIVEILEGKEGIKTLMDDVIKQKSEWFVFGTQRSSIEIVGTIAKHFESQRQKEKIFLKAIFVKSPLGLKRAKDFLKMQHTQIRFDESTRESLHSTWIYSDRVAIIFWDKEHPFVIRIIDKGLAENYKDNFNLSWKSSTKSEVIYKHHKDA